MKIYSRYFPSILPVISFLFYSHSFAISVSDIPNISNIENGQFIVKAITEDIEPYASKWSNKWVYSVDKDTVKQRIYSIIRLLDHNSLPNNRSEALLVKSLLWHYLYQLEVDSAYYKVEKVTSKVLSKQKLNKNLADWIKGVHLICSNRIRAGFLLLDSLRTVEHFQNENFLMDYARLSAECFLPADDSVVKIIQPVSCFGENDSEFSPVQTGWSIVNNLEKFYNSVPVFQFTSSYILSGQIPLLFSLRYREPVRLKLTVADQIMEKVYYPLLYDFTVQKQVAKLKILITGTDDKISMGDQLRSVVENRYEIIRDGIKTGQLRGISLRCYNRSLYSDVPGDFCGYVIFEKIINGHRPQFHSNPSKNSGWMKIRYLISISTTTDVEYKAISILEDIISRFRTLR